MDDSPLSDPPSLAPVPLISPLAADALALRMAVGQTLDATVPSDLPHAELTAGDLTSRRRGRRVRLPLLLFVATCASTFWAGAADWMPHVLLFAPQQVPAMILQNWDSGLLYMAAVIGILLAHEMGHFLQAVRYGVPASLPFFIPLPIVLTGTMGAVIGIEGSKADRKQLFDIGLTGPWAGLMVALPVVAVGILHGEPETTPVVGFHLEHPLIFKLFTWYLRPELPGDVVFQWSPLLMAGWVGMLITGLNMMPVSQLDGGHVIYALFGRRAHGIARAFVLLSIAAMIIADYYQWVVMLVVVLLLGIDHPPTRDDQMPLGIGRTIVGLVSLAIPIFCFTPRIV